MCPPPSPCRSIAQYTELANYPKPPDLPTSQGPAYTLRSVHRASRPFTHGNPSRLFTPDHFRSNFCARVRRVEFLRLAPTERSFLAGVSVRFWGVGRVFSPGLIGSNFLRPNSASRVLRPMGYGGSTRPVHSYAPLPHTTDVPLLYRRSLTAKIGCS